jgi:hypothetical protein
MNSDEENDRFIMNGSLDRLPHNIREKGDDKVSCNTAGVEMRALLSPARVSTHQANYVSLSKVLLRVGRDRSRQYQCESCEVTGLSYHFS